MSGNELGNPVGQAAAGFAVIDQPSRLAQGTGKGAPARTAAATGWPWSREARGQAAASWRLSLLGHLGLAEVSRSAGPHAAAVRRGCVHPGCDGGLGAAELLEPPCPQGLAIRWPHVVEYREAARTAGGCYGS